MWGLGHGLTRLIKPPSNPFEKEFLRLGFGIGLFSILAIILNLLHIPLHWLLFLILGMISPLGVLFKVFKKQVKFPKIEVSKENIFFVIIIILFLAHFLIFLKGSFSYPYLEDGDPWDHSRSIRYIASQKTTFEPSTSDELFKFMDAYPPIFDILMAVLYQVNGNMIWTLKFFNALIVSLSLIFFYIFTKKLFNDPTKALIATIILFLIPSYMSHFIWALVMSMVLFFPCLYALESIKDDPKWKYIAAVMIGALLVSQPSMAVVLSFMLFLYWIVKSIIHHDINKNIIIAGLLGIIISSIWWLPVYIRWGSPLENEWAGVYSPNMVENQKRLGQFSSGFRIIGTADRIYTFSDFFFVSKTNMINNPIGIGPILLAILFLSIIYLLFNIKSLFKVENEWKVLCLVWLVFTFLGIHGARLPIQFIAFRFWMLFAIPVSFLVGGVLTEMIGTKTFSRIVLVILVLVGVGITSGIVKYQINTSVWGPGYMINDVEYFAYMKFDKEFPEHQSVFSACSDSTYKLAAYDQDECLWCPKDVQIRRTFVNQTPEDLHSFLKNESYKYLLIDLSCLNTWDDWEFQVAMMNLGYSNLFEQAYNFNGILVLSPK